MRRRLLTVVLAVALAGCASAAHGAARTHAPTPAASNRATATAAASTVTAVITATIKGPSPATRAWGAMAWVSTTEGWAVRGGRILHTLDGGHTWTVQYAGPATVVDIAASGPATAWAAANTCSQPNVCDGVLLAMSAHGWATLHAFPGVRLASVAVASGLLVQTGPSIGSSWLHSADGGRTWSPLANPCHWSAFVSFPYVLCAGQPGAGNEGKRLLYTPDGGRSWRTVTAVQIGQPEPPGHLQSGGYATGIYFVDAQRGWMGITGAAGGIAETTDGGRTWQPGGPDVQVQGVAYIDFPTPSRGFAVAWQGVPSFLITTADGGQTWEQLAPPLGPASLTYVMAPALAARGQSGFVSAGPLLQPESVIGSDANGSAWTVLGTPPAQGPVASVSFPTADAGWAVVGASLVATRDGGRTWRLVAGVPRPALVSFATPSEGLVVSTDGSLYGTTDGGDSFRALGPRFLTARALQLVTPTDGWVLYGPGRPGPTLAHTVDGGRTWQAVDIPDDLAAQDISFPDPNHGFVLTSSCIEVRPCAAHLVVTADGGHSWRVIQVTAPDLRPTAIAFASPALGLMITDEDAVYATGDGGLTWTEKP